MRIILASSSENRAELFRRMSVKFEIFPPDFEEKISAKIPPEKQVKKLALGKARSVFSRILDENVLILGFDSMIEFEGDLIGKPNGRNGARAMLKRFLGKSQTVISGVAVVGRLNGEDFKKVTAERTKVRFRGDVSDAELEKYLDFEDFSGKCGAYSILGTGIFLLEKIDGDFQNIVGVPVMVLGRMIREIFGRSAVEIFEPAKT